MAISYVGGVQGGRAGSTSTTTQSLSGTLSGGSNTSPSAGDLVVVLCAAGADTTAAPSQDISGNNNGAYTGLTAQSSVVATTYDTYSRVSYKIQGSTVDTTITIPSSGSARNAQRWVVHVFRGVDSTTPMDVTATYATGTGTGRPNPAAIEPTTAGAWIAAFYASAAGTGAAYTAPTDFATDWLGGTTVDTADVMTGGGYYTGWTSGSYDPAAITAGGTTNAADTWTATTIALRPALPAFTQAAFRYYADGTETGSTALETQDTNHTADVSSGDVNLQLRVRLQETAGNPGDSTDDYQLQYELNDSSTWQSVTPSTATTIDSYSESNVSGFGYEIRNGSNVGVGQSVSGDGNRVSTAKFYIRKVGSPTGNATAKLYAITGTHGTNATPTGSALATSDNFSVSTLTTSFSLATFTFTGANIISLDSSTKYFLTLEYSGGDASNRVEIGYDSTSPAHAGNIATFNGSSWTSNTLYDLIFYLDSAVSIIVNGYNSSSLTDGNATTNRLGSGTGSFVAGEISEDGLVDDLQITASNYTELLYSLTIDSDAVADADTLDFRVLRNGATTGMTYTVTPRITIEKSTGSFNLTPGIATLTLTAQTPTVTATNNQAITLASPSALSITAQTPTAKLDNRVTPGIATLTLTAQTPTVAVTNNYAITTASPTALTLTPQTPTVASTDNKAITLASPTALTLTPQTPTVTVSANQTVTPDIATLTTTAHIIGVAVSDNQALTPGAGSLTLTALTPTVAFTDNKSITTASPSSLTLSPQTPSVTATDNKAITLASPSGLTLTAQSPTVDVTANVAVTPGIATLTTSNWTPTVAFTANQAITTATPTALTITAQTPTVAYTDNYDITLASPSSLTLTAQTPTVTSTANVAVTPGIATLTLTALAPTVSFTANQAITTASPSSLTLSPQTPTVSATDNKTITLASPTALSLTAQTPTVSATNNIAITTASPTALVITNHAPGVAVSSSSALTPGTASLTLTPQTPTVTATNHIAVTPDTASLTTSRLTPSVVATDNKSIALQTASLSLTVYAPTVSATTTTDITPGTASLTLTAQTPTVVVSDNIEITPGVASMLTAMFAPDVSVSQNQTITPGTAQLRLTSSYPIVNGQIRERDYYIDSDANVFWVINQAIGLVEKV